MFRRGWVFKDGKLLMFDEDAVLVLRGWPVCLAWRKADFGGWAAARPAGTIVRAIHATARPRYLKRLGDERDERRRIGLAQRSLAARRFIDPFPRAVLGVVTPLPERQWHVLSLVARCPGALDLARDNPALAFALASSWVFRASQVAQPMRAARALVLKKRTAILDALGFPPSPANARVLAKLPRRDVTIQALLYLRETLREPDVPKSLHHLPRLDAGVLRIVCDARLRRLATHALLEDVAAESPRTHRAAYLLADAAAMHEAVQGAPLRPQRSLADLRELHDELVEKLNRSSARSPVPRLVMPAPPLEGTREITPLRDAAAIAAEGREMHHCVASYVDRVASGAAYVYRVDAPERATLSLVRTAHGWQLGELRGFANEPVRPATRVAVCRWLESCGVGTITLYRGDAGVPF
jgi:PcfJ-like protein